jgi:predicted CoA-binding protein
VARADVRLHVAVATSLEPVFRPRAVAVVGASRKPGSIGHALFRNLLAGGFAGPVYPVNPAAPAVASVRAYPTVGAIPDQVDLAVIVVPAASVLAAAQESLDAGVRGLVVISAGFAEVGEEGRQRQDALLHLCRARGARLIGPNCMGVLARDPDGALNATFAPTLPPPGPVAISSQSGALARCVSARSRRTTTTSRSNSQAVRGANAAAVTGPKLQSTWNPSSPENFSRYGSSRASSTAQIAPATVAASARGRWRRSLSSANHRAPSSLRSSGKKACASRCTHLNSAWRSGIWIHAPASSWRRKITWPSNTWRSAAHRPARNGISAGAIRS